MARGPRVVKSRDEFEGEIYETTTLVEGRDLPAALDGQFAVLGKEHPETQTSMNNLAAVLWNQGKYKEAEAIHRQALGLREKVLGREHLETLARKNNLAMVLQSQGKYEEAEAIHRQALGAEGEGTGQGASRDSEEHE